MKDIFTVIGAVVAIVVIILIAPVISFIAGALTGWILWQIFPFAGRWVVEGLAMLGLDVSLASLPLLTATLGFIGGFFKSSPVSRKK